MGSYKLITPLITTHGPPSRVLHGPSPVMLGLSRLFCDTTCPVGCFGVFVFGYMRASLAHSRVLKWTTDRGFF